jgi:hypothetical protein
MVEVSEPPAHNAVQGGGWKKTRLAPNPEAEPLE